MNQPQLFDIVELLVDIPQQNIKAGMQGAIVEVYGDRNYEIDISNSDGETLALCTLSSKDFVMIWHNQDIKPTFSEKETHFQASIHNLYALKEMDEDERDDEDDIIFPSEYAFDEASKLLTQVHKVLGQAFPYCAASLESRGGINLVWDNPVLKRRIWVEIPVSAEFKRSIFHREQEVSQFINYLDVEQLVKLLISTYAKSANSSNIRSS